MSLIIETLKKLKNKNKNENTVENDEKLVPPELKKENNDKKAPSKRIYIYIAVIVILGAISVFAVNFYNNYYKSSSFVALQNQEIINRYKNETKPKNPENIEPPPKEIQQKEEGINKVETTKENKNSDKILEKPPIELIAPKIDEDDKISTDNEQNKDFKEKKETFVNNVSLGEYYFSSNNFANAKIYYQKALKIKTDRDIIKRLAYIYIKSGDLKGLDKFLEEYKHYIDEDVIFYIGINLAKFRYIDKLAEYVNKYNYLNNRDLISYLKGIVEEKNGNLNRAIFLYELAYIKNKNKYLIGYSYARLLEIGGYYKKALKVYESLTVKDSKLAKIVKERIKILRSFEK